MPTEASDADGTENGGNLLPLGRYSHSDHDRRMSESTASMSAGMPPMGTGANAYHGGFGYHDYPGGRPASPMTSASGAGGSHWGGTPSTTTATTSRKSPLPPSLRPVNIIQHDDAGTVGDESETADTVELPPAYTNIKRQ